MSISVPERTFDILSCKEKLSFFWFHTLIFCSYKRGIQYSIKQPELIDITFEQAHYIINS
ncbi:MAG TPA: hypothetical protein PLE24_04760 [Chitinispirillaceae bacterium]|nr:hypothetical protein [Chitinispirillaceae bacterium]